MSSVEPTRIPPPAPSNGPFDRLTNFDVTKSSVNIEKWKWLFDKLGYNNEANQLYFRSGSILHSCINQTAMPEFYRALQLTPDFRGQQALLMLHVWIVHRRLVKEGTHGKLIQEHVFDRLWEETSFRLRHQEISELTVNKYLNEVQQMCFSACVAYDRGLEENGAEGLISPLSKHLLNEEKNAKYVEATAMSKYVMKHLKAFESAPFADLEVGAIPWGPRLLNRDPVSNTVAELESHISGRQYKEWRSALDARGRIYYWNMRTRISSWDLPIDHDTNEAQEAC